MTETELELTYLAGELPAGLAVFSKPDFCLADVTQEELIAGGKLAGRVYVDIQPDLDRYGYKPLTLGESLHV